MAPYYKFSINTQTQLRRSPARTEPTAGDGFDSDNWMETVPNEDRIGGIAVGCAIGTAVLIWILCYCWKYCRPKPTYYETAIKINKERRACQCRERGGCSEDTNRQNSSSPWLHAVTVLNEPAIPVAARVQSPPNHAKLRNYV
ncbi:hypothetical protein GGS21DRAFT_544812 [Xylaria nigripes]|nr:hypothetical protein GGS21DRAFT_544812 [Xylaria nigripes]